MSELRIVEKVVDEFSKIETIQTSEVMLWKECKWYHHFLLKQKCNLKFKIARFKDADETVLQYIFYTDITSSLLPMNISENDSINFLLSNGERIVLNCEKGSSSCEEGAVHKCYPYYLIPNEKIKELKTYNVEKVRLEAQGEIYDVILEEENKELIKRALSLFDNL